MARLHPIPCGTGLLLLPDFPDHIDDFSDPDHDERVVKPARRTKEFRRARV